MKIVFASHTHINQRLVVGSHHFARKMAEAGHDVLHVSVPVTLAHVAKLGELRCRERFGNWWAGGQKVEPRLMNYVPLALVPWQMARRRLTASSNLLVDSMWRFSAVIRRFGFQSPDLLLIDEPRLVGIQQVLKPTRTFYRATDLYSEFRDDPAVKEAEKILVTQSNGIIGTSGPVLAWLQSIAPALPSLLLENGVDYAHFSTARSCPAEYADLPSPRAVYVGALDERFDFAAIETLAAQRPDISVILIGPATVPVPESLKQRKNVLHLGSRPYKAMPAYLQHADIGLLPFNAHAANRGRSPMKLYEYACANLPVVSAATEEVVRRREEFVFTYASAAEISVAMDAALTAKSAPASAQSAALGRDWRQLTEQLLSFVTTAG